MNKEMKDDTPKLLTMQYANARGHIKRDVIGIYIYTNPKSQNHNPFCQWKFIINLKKKFAISILHLDEYCTNKGNGEKRDKESELNGL